MSDVRSLPPKGPTVAPVELFGHVWDRSDTPDGYAAAVEHLETHPVDPKDAA